MNVSHTSGPTRGKASARSSVCTISPVGLSIETLDEQEDPTITSIICMAEIESLEERRETGAVDPFASISVQT
jgi:hypothetical protein